MEAGIEVGREKVGTVEVGSGYLEDETMLYHLVSLHSWAVQQVFV